MTKNIIIQTAQPEQITTIRQCIKSDIVSDVFTGTILDKGETKQMFFKAYDFDSQQQTIAQGDRGLLNEIIGYLACHLLHIPQPPSAYIALVPKNRLERLLPDTSQRLANSLGDMSMIPMFATEQVAPKALPIYHNHDQPALLSLFSKWEYFKPSAIIDEVIVNTDRFPRNIMNFGKSFWLIDNGKLVIEQGTNWQAKDLKAEQNYTNYIADITRPDIQADNRKGDALIQKAHMLSSNITNIIPECEFWIELLAHQQDKADWIKFLQFIQQRYHNIANLLIQRYGMLL